MSDGSGLGITDSAISYSETSSSALRSADRQVDTIHQEMERAKTVDLKLRIGDEHLIVLDAPQHLRGDIENIAQRLSELSQLGNDWDSYGGHPITEKSLQNAFRLAFDVLYRKGLLALIGPVAAGGISLEWLEEPREIEIEIVDDDASLLLVDNGDEREFERISVARAKMLLQDWLIE